MYYAWLHIAYKAQNFFVHLYQKQMVAHYITVCYGFSCNKNTYAEVIIFTASTNTPPPPLSSGCSSGCPSLQSSPFTPWSGDIKMLFTQHIWHVTGALGPLNHGDIDGGPRTGAAPVSSARPRYPALSPPLLWIKGPLNTQFVPAPRPPL